MDITRQVFSRSVRLGLSYVILGVVMGLVTTILLNVAVRAGSSVAGAPIPPGEVNTILGLMVVPFSAIIGLVISTPVYLLFVNDKSVGVLEYLLAVGMNQRDIFWGYLKAALLLALIAIVPMVVLNAGLARTTAEVSASAAVLGVVTGSADVALVTVLMTAYSALQKRPTGMNQPVGISIGILVVLPEFFLIALVREGIIVVDAFVALAILGVSVGFLLVLDRVIRREKLLP